MAANKTQNYLQLQRILQISSNDDEVSDGLQPEGEDKAEEEVIGAERYILSMSKADCHCCRVYLTSKGIQFRCFAVEMKSGVKIADNAL